MRRVLVGFVLLIFGCEIFSRLWVAGHPERTYIDYLVSPAPAYDNAPYWSESFKQALRDSVFSCHYNTGVSYHSEYINFDNCRRRVVAQSNVNRRVWLFGNSIVFGNEVPDEYTIASQLQVLLPDWRIENVTDPGASVLGMLTMLEQEPLQAGDVVIFYSGVGDALGLWDAILRKHPQEYYEVPCAVFNAARDTIYSFRPFCDWRLSHVPESAYADTYLLPQIKTMTERYADTLDEARRLTAQRGARFLNILQPHLWSRPLTADEQIVHDVSVAGRPHVDRAVTLAWPYLQAYADVDLTHVLDEVRDTQVVFYDAWHMDETAGAIIAQAIAGAVR